jgi:hypothetical protein
VPIFSRRFSLWTRLYERMLLEPTPDARVTPMVSEVVVPILDADALLQTPTLPATVSLDLTPSQGYVVGFTVPAGEEWELIYGRRSASAGGSEVQVNIAGVRISATTDGTTTEIFNLRDIILREDDSIGMSATNNASDSGVSLIILYNTRDLT